MGCIVESITLTPRLRYNRCGGLKRQGHPYHIVQGERTARIFYSVTNHLRVDIWSVDMVYGYAFPEECSTKPVTGTLSTTIVSFMPEDGVSWRRAPSARLWVSTIHLQQTFILPAATHQNAGYAIP